MADDDLVFKSGQELAALIKARQVSAVDVVRAYLARIDALNPKVNAYITVTADQALARARQADREIAAGKYLGPLHGLPYAPKDILATKGIRTTNGSKVTADWIPTYESTITARLNKAGAVLIGKLNLLAFAMGSGVLSGFGPARNPWDLDYGPGGSSSGSGVALAAYMTPLAVGTDTGGSIRVPAALCGIVGLKQTYGRVSRYGVTTLSWTLDHAGPMTKTVADAAMMLQAMAGPDPRDATAAHEPVPDYSKALTGDIRGLRIDVPPANLAGSAGWIIAMAEGACFHEQRLKEKPELFDPLVRERLEAAKFYPAVDYVKSMRIRTLLMDEMRQVFQKCDVMAVPGGGPAGKLDSPERARSDVKPGSASTAFRGGNTFIGDMTGLPAIVIPCGFTAGPPVLPLTIQFYGKPFDETTLFRVSHAYESATDWHKRRPPLSAGSSRTSAGGDQPI